MTRKLAMSAMRPPSAPIPAASGALCPSPLASELPSRARMGTLMVRIGNHLVNAG
jgi:hypothetical protein